MTSAKADWYEAILYGGRGGDPTVGLRFSSEEKA